MGRTDDVCWRPRCRSRDLAFEPRSGLRVRVRVRRFTRTDLEPHVSSLAGGSPEDEDGMPPVQLFTVFRLGRWPLFALRPSQGSGRRSRAGWISNKPPEEILLRSSKLYQTLSKTQQSALSVLARCRPGVVQNRRPGLGATKVPQPASRIRTTTRAPGIIARLSNLSRTTPQAGADRL
ncbi:hypothetical protein VTN02DRAFT_2561 [Thermoascus thermophilus]